MGVMRFVTPQPERVSDEVLQRAYVSGWDCIPTRSRMSWESERLLRLDRAIDESGNLYLPWRVRGHGELLLATASLMERERPYLLPVELARGTLNRLRSKADIWSLAGLRLSATVAERIKAAVSSFMEATTQQQDEPRAAASADDAIQRSLDAMLLLGDEYARQVLEFRHQTTSPLSTLLAGNLGYELMKPTAEPMFGAAFNTAVIPFAWRKIQPAEDQWDWSLSDKQMQFCVRYGLKVLGGPLVQLDRDVLPDWVLPRVHEPEWLGRNVQQFITATIERYRTRVHLWHCASGINKPTELPVDEEQGMRLSVLAIETARRLDPRTPLIIGLDQPWGEYLAFDQADLPPMHFADTLIRADLGIAGLGLELNLGYWPGGSLPRDVLEISELVDQWSLLGLPLILFLTCPSSHDPDDSARPDAGRPLAACLAEELTPQTHKALVERLLPVLLAKQSVHALVWNQLFDSVPHKYPHAGLFNIQGLPKPALSVLIALRREHLE
jgi:hypothetical protein